MINALFLKLLQCKPGLTVEEFSDIVQYSKTCREQTGVPVEMMPKVLVGFFEDDPRLKAQLFCMIKKMGLQEDNGDFNIKGIRQKLKSFYTEQKDMDECVGPTNIQKKILSAHIQNCMAQTGTTEAMLAKVKSGVMVDDPNFIKFIFCVEKLSGLINENGDIYKEALEIKTTISIGSLEKTIAMADKCSQYKSTPEETAYELYKCYMLDGYNLFEQ
ncbi:unnamed protein product [Brassicogethes aeneus]|uniref:Uncharacterized protein n=1 Tax=Brassicogethes aeneus TaxID=1431903 RepID=A0A9P0FFC5_BRAAE|nr:unnamed protein product [Brassicogethes aeneus]